MGKINFDFKLWTAFVLLLLIPSVLNLVRLHFIGNLPNEWGFNIASQIQWLNIVYEILQEAFLIPLFFMLATARQTGRETFLNTAANGLMVVFAVYLLLAAGVWTFADALLPHTGISPQLIGQTSEYIRLESLALMGAVAGEYLIVYLAVTGQYRQMMVFSVCKTALLLLADVFLIADNRFSLQLGVNGIALSNLAVNTLLTVWLAYRIRLLDWIRRHGIRWDGAWLKHWFALGAFSGLESLIRNVVFAVMILAMVNQIGNQGVYWVANSVIWGVLLVPALALSEVVKRDVAADADNIRLRTRSYLGLATVFVLLWLLSIPLWQPFLSHALQVREADTVLSVMLLQTGFYCVFIFNYAVLDATLKGLGLTRYMLYQSVCIDVVYYGVVFVLYQAGMVSMSLQTISLIFGIGMVLDMLPTMYLYAKALRQRGMRWQEVCFAPKV
ncbi:hypothetical protein LNQ82_05430 [Conchiformibius steedae DSM 2580]|uniref:Uncharacterized protein n=1 Tax=Conchiformibius steedae DSM 2580 TaxID=1121352 RepID=A0AAE9KZ60_9NEIS|nr:MATE family Na+-driven efflux transporter [Conchiformibius steedae]QMT33916.1 hypothetical protein H3L98_02505 [Conchiformibius steedae]URD66684.1 hypothetical protein LNQ82_05430 [Conchiformibius steedae DSM 2580]